jgi:hypothetical protein
MEGIETSDLIRMLRVIDNDLRSLDQRAPDAANEREQLLHSRRTVAWELLERGVDPDWLVRVRE